MSKSLNVTLPVLAVMNGENPTSNFTVLPDSPVTARDDCESEMVVVSLRCIPSFNCSAVAASTSCACLSVRQGRSLHPHVLIVSDPSLSTYEISSFPCDGA